MCVCVCVCVHTYTVCSFYLTLPARAVSLYCHLPLKTDVHHSREKRNAQPKDSGEGERASLPHHFAMMLGEMECPSLSLSLSFFLFSYELVIKRCSERVRMHHEVSCVSRKRIHWPHSPFQSREKVPVFSRVSERKREREREKRESEINTSARIS